MFSDYVRKTRAFFSKTSRGLWVKSGKIQAPIWSQRMDIAPAAPFSSGQCFPESAVTGASQSSPLLGLSLPLSWEDERLHIRTKSFSSLNSFPRKMQFCKIAKHLRYVTPPIANVCRTECSVVLALTCISSVILARSAWLFLLGLSPIFWTGNFFQNRHCTGAFY